MTELETIRLTNWYDKCRPEFGDTTDNMEIHIIQEYVWTQGDIAGGYIKEAEEFLLFMKQIYWIGRNIYDGVKQNGYKGDYFDFLLHMWCTWDEKYKNNWRMENYPISSDELTNTL